MIARAACPAERTQAGFRALCEQSPRVMEQRESQAIQLSCGGDRDLFQRMLELRGLDRDSYRASLCEVEVDQVEALPDWALLLLSWYGQDVAPGGLPRAAASTSPGGLFQPFLVRARDELAPNWERPELVQKLGPDLVADLLSALERRLRFVSSFTLGSTFSEVDAAIDPARRVGQPVGEVFLGHPGLELADWLRVFEAFPVLGRLMATLYGNWRSGVELFLYRLQADWSEIEALFFSGDNLGKLQSVLAPEGADHHGGGQQVMMLTFEGDRRLVYKPRDLRLGEVFLELWSGLEGTHRRRLLVRDDYTWDEYLVPQACTDERQVKSYYSQLGKLVRMSELLNSRDLHRDNLMAVGEHPVIVDLETVVQPYMPAEDNPGELTWSSLLTSPFFGDAGCRALDCGVLAGHRTQDAPFRAFSTSLTPVPCLAFFGDSVPEPMEFLFEIESGYGEMDEFLAQHGAELDPRIQAMAGLSFRYVYRKTDHYVRLILGSLQPGMLRDGLRRDAYFEQLYRTSLRWQHSPALAASEIEALRGLDVPVVFGLIGDRALLCEDGSRIEDFFQEGFLDLLRRRLEDRSPDERQRRRRALRTVLATLRRNTDAASGPVLDLDMDESDQPLDGSPVDWLGQAMQVGEALLEAVSARPWTALGYVPWADFWLLGKTNQELWAGSGGWAVVCAELAHASGDARFTEAASALADELAEGLSFWTDKFAKVRRSPKENLFCGAYHGLGGQLHALLRCARLLDRSDFRDKALDMLESLPLLLCLERSCEGWVMGVAGLLPALLEAEAYRPGLREAREAVVEALRDAPSKRPDPIPPSSSSLNGLPHGQEAVRYALARAAVPDENRLAPPPVLAEEPLDRLEQALDAYGWSRDQADLVRAEEAARRLLAGRVKSGTWFPRWGVADEYHLCALTGLGAVSLAFLRLHNHATTPSLRLLESR